MQSNELWFTLYNLCSYDEHFEDECVLEYDM